jgi:hypothetical protein
MELAESIIRMQRKEVKTMKIATSFLAALLFTSALGALNNAVADDGVLLKQEFTPGSYCHEKFPAVRPSTLYSDQPVLKDSSTGDVIDYYGPCDESPRGQDQVQQQRYQNLPSRDYDALDPSDD